MERAKRAVNPYACLRTVAERASTRAKARVDAFVRGRVEDDRKGIKEGSGRHKS